MFGRTLIVAAMLTAAPALARESVPPGETTIPRMSGFLEWRPDGNQALYIQGDTGRWYHATLEAPCPRLVTRTRVRFNASPSDRFDRHSSIRADGWRCLVSSVTALEGAPPPRR
jgi:hypothetical protein